MSQSKVIIGFGGNKASTLDIFQKARPMLESLIGSCLKTSRIYRSKPMVIEGADPQLFHDFLNGAALFESELSPHEILHHCFSVEKSFGRDRAAEKKWESRSLDLDIISMGLTVTSDTELTIPHPDMAQRDFVLYPVQDLDPRFIHPVTARSVDEMIAQLSKRYINEVEGSTF